ncbi:Glycosyl transferases group 1 [Vibrio sp. THAF190c]|nr:Glycosyl transferases group 1 [Vibrio sp. THAF190c]
MTIFAKLIGAKVVHTIHGNEFNTRIWFNLLAAKLSHRLLCLNEVIFQRLRKQFGDKVFKVTPILACADDKNHQRISKRIEKDRKTLLLYAAGKVYIKGEEVYGVEFVVNMLPKLIDKGYELILLDPKNEYEDIASKSGLKYENHFRHITNYIDFNQLLNNVDIYLRPTSTDGQSVAVLEALSAGTKVIASDSVPRPRGVILYKFGSESSFLESLKTKVESESSPELTDVKGYLRILHGG